MLSIVLIALVLGAVGALGYVVANPGAGERLTEFYYLGLDGEPIPKGHLHVQSGGKGEIKLFVVNREGEEVNYIVKVKIGENFVDVEVNGVTMSQIPVTPAHGGAMGGEGYFYAS